MDKKGEAKVQGMAVTSIQMPSFVLLPHMRRTLRKTYTQKMALLSAPVIPQSTEYGYKLRSEKELL